MSTDKPITNPEELDRRRKAEQLTRIADWTEPKPKPDQSKPRDDSPDT